MQMQGYISFSFSKNADILISEALFNFSGLCSKTEENFSSQPPAVAPSFPDMPHPLHRTFGTTLSTICNANTLDTPVPLGHFS
jgi:hypothetical protein